jgi:PAS domain S-box-containing protein
MKPRISLKTAWYGLIVLVALVPIAILLSWLGFKAYAVLLESALLREVQINEVIKTHVDDEVSRITTLLQNKSDPMAYTLSGAIDKELLYGLLDAVISREDAVHVLALLDRQGRVVVGKDRHGDPLLAATGSGEAGGQKEGAAGREPLFDPKSPEVVIPMHGRIYTGPPFLREGRWNFHLAVPVGPPIHRPLAVLLATIDAGKLWQGIQSQLARPGVSTYVVDSRGRLLAPPAGSALPAGALLSHMDIVRSLIANKSRDKTDTYIGLNGLSSFGITTPIDLLNWGIIVEIPEGTITGPIAATLMYVAVIAAALVVVFGVVGLWLVNQMLRPMSELSGAFDRAARGDYSQPIPSSSVKEFNTLSVGFNRMHSEIQQREEVLREGEERYRGLVEGMYDLVQSVDSEGRFVFVNRAWRDTMGYTQQEVSKLSVWDVIHPKSIKHCQEVFGKVMSGEDIRSIEATFRNKSGTAIIVEGNITTSLMKGKVITAQGIFRDITERKQTEEKLAKHREQLEGLVDERTAELRSANEELTGSQEALASLLEDVNESRADLEKANEKLKELDRLKSMFIASMSHELRTPLNSIIGFTGIILQGMAGKLNAEQTDQLRRVYASAKHLLELITDVIDISKIEAGKVEPYVEGFELDEVITEAILSLNIQIDKKGLTVETSIPQGLHLKTDRKRLLQCILNYLSNAVKFTEKGKISISVDDIDNAVEINVKDTGIGIEKDDISKLFNSFVRLDSPLKLTTSGTGLGLYLTKKLATEVLKGSVSVESKYGEGSTFVLKIPKEIKSV